MDELRTPCEHRGGPDVVKSGVGGFDTDGVELCICTQCRRFWLERNGWLLSRRETLGIIRSSQIGKLPQPAENPAAARLVR